MARPIKEAKTGCWLIHFSHAGKQFKKSTGSTNLATAKALQAKVNHRLEQLKLGLLAIPEGRSLRDFVFDEPVIAVDPEPASDAAGKAIQAPTSLDAFARDHLRLNAPPAKAETTHRTETTHINHLLAFADEHGGRSQPVSALTPRFFEEYKAARSGKVGAVTVNKELSTFRGLMAAAVRDGLLATNPLNQIKRLKTDEYQTHFRTGEEINRALSAGKYDKNEARRIRRFRFLTPEEIGRLLAIVEGTPIGGIMRLLAYTGMRLSEARRLEWLDVEFDIREITVRSWKGSRHKREKLRTVDMHPDLASWLRDLRTRHPDNRWVLGYEADQTPNRHTIRDQITRILDETEFQGIGFHALRHSMASNLAAAGVDERVIDEILGHSTIEMRKRYRHLYPKDRRAAIGVLRFDKPRPKPVAGGGPQSAGVTETAAKTASGEPDQARARGQA